MNDDIDAYPLAWPVGWPRAKHRLRANFGAKGQNGKRPLTPGEGRDRLLAELGRLGARRLVISTNAPTRNDGYVRADVSNPRDPGAAVYFRLNDEPRVLATDRWDRLADNLAALAAHIEALRAIERYGVGSLAQAFAGYKALAAVGARLPWWQVLGFKERPQTYEHAAKRYIDLMAQHHPDKGGNPNQAAEINAAWQEGRKEMGL